MNYIFPLFVLVFSNLIFLQTLNANEPIRLTPYVTSERPKIVTPAIDCGSDPNLVNPTCSYSVQQADTQQLIDQAITDLDPDGSLDATTQGFIRRGSNPKEIIFQILDKKLKTRLETFLLRRDVPPVYISTQPVLFRLDYYLISQEDAITKGFEINFAKGGLLEENIPRITGDGSVLDLNFGNLTSKIISLSLNRIRQSGVAITRESRTFIAYDTDSLSYSEEQIFYLINGGYEPKMETGVKAVSGRVSIDPKNKKLIRISNFNFQYFTPSTDPRSLLQTQSIPFPQRTFESGIQQIIFANDSTLKGYDRETGLFNYEKTTTSERVHVVVTLTAYTEEENPEFQENINYNISRDLYSYTDQYLARRPLGNRTSIDSLLGKENLKTYVIESPIGILGQILAMQFKPESMTRELAGVRVKVTLRGEGIKDISRTLELQNLIAGPMLNNQIDLRTLDKKQNDVLKLTLTIEDQRESRITNENLFAKHGLKFSPFKKTYTLKYTPGIAKVDVE